MSLGVQQPIPTRQLIIPPQNRAAIGIGVTGRLGPYVTQGYGWIVGNFRLVTAGAINSTFNVYQGFQDLTAVPPIAPVFGRWNVNNAFVAAPNIVVPFKIVVLDQACYFTFTNLSGVAGIYEFAAYLRND